MEEGLCHEDPDAGEVSMKAETSAAEESTQWPGTLTFVEAKMMVSAICLAILVLGGEGGGGVSEVPVCAETLLPTFAPDGTAPRLSQFPVINLVHLSNKAPQQGQHTSLL